MIKRNDILLFIGVLILGGVIFFAVNTMKHDGGQVDVSIDGKILASYPLDSDDQIDIEYNGYNKLVIKDGKAFIAEADCPDKLCTKQRKISKTGETIICLPHKTVISISGAEKSEVDGVIE